MSVDAVILAAAALGLLLFGGAPFGVDDVVVENERHGAWYYVWAVATNGAFVTITFVKGKVWVGLLRTLVPLLALVGRGSAGAADLALGRPA